MKLLRKILLINLLLILLTLLFILFSNLWIVSYGKSRTVSLIEDLKPRDVALVLGTSSSKNGKDENLFFTYRMKAAADLYHSGKVKHFILSGDNSNEKYNEPQDMKNKLMALGVPQSAITLDFGGRRTLDSVVRCKKIFQQSKIIIVSQAFHNYRALFIAKYYGLDALGFNAKYPDKSSSKTIIREIFARPKAVLDLFIFKTKPKIMGDKENIKI
jgi:SanA protein